MKTTKDIFWRIVVCIGFLLTFSLFYTQMEVNRKLNKQISTQQTQIKELQKHMKIQKIYNGTNTLGIKTINCILDLHTEELRNLKRRY